MSDSYLSKNNPLSFKDRVAQIVKGIWPSHQKRAMCLNDLKKTPQNLPKSILETHIKKKRFAIHIVWEHYISFN